MGIAYFTKFQSRGLLCTLLNIFVFLGKELQYHFFCFFDIQDSPFRPLIFLEYSYGPRVVIGSSLFISQYFEYMLVNECKAREDVKGYLAKQHVNRCRAKQHVGSQFFNNYRYRSCISIHVL